MLKENYDQLMYAAAKKDYISIGITEGGAPIRSIFVPWEQTTSAFNMKKPRITLAPEDLNDEKIREALRKCTVVGCYIFTVLEDYSFIEEFDALKDLFILHGENIRDLSFLFCLPELFMFYIEDAELKNLKPLVEAFNNSEPMPWKCIFFNNCKVKNTSALSDANFYISELLIYPVEGDKRERWELAKKVDIFRFYDREDR